MKNLFAFIKSIFAFLYGLSFGAFGIICLTVGYLKGQGSNELTRRPKYKYSDYFYKGEK